MPRKEKHDYTATERNNLRRARQKEAGFEWRQFKIRPEWREKILELIEKLKMGDVP